MSEAEFLHKLKLGLHGHITKRDADEALEMFLNLVKERDALRAALKLIRKELGDSPTLFEYTGDHYYQNASTKISTALGLVKEALAHK